MKLNNKMGEIIKGFLGVINVFKGNGNVNGDFNINLRKYCYEAKLDIDTKLKIIY